VLVWLQASKLGALGLDMFCYWSLRGFHLHQFRGLPSFVLHIATAPILHIQQDIMSLLSRLCAFNKQQDLHCCDMPSKQLPVTFLNLI